MVTTRAGRRTPGRRPGAWPSMAVYWLACAALAWRGGYWAQLVKPSVPPSPPWATALGLVAAAAPQPFYFRAVGAAAAAARPARSWPGIALFAAANGVLESFAFRAVTDAGSAAAGGGGAAWGGLAALALYCGAIHACFWERVFPPHLPRAGSAEAQAMRRALALFLPMTAAFAALDLRSLVVAHILADACAGAALRLPPPW